MAASEDAGLEGIEMRPPSVSTASLQSVELEGGATRVASGDAARLGRTLSSEQLGPPGGADVDEHGMTKSSMGFASFNFVNSIIGAGIIGLPFALREAGFAAGLFLLCSVGAMTYYSVVMLVELGVSQKKVNYEELAQHVFGLPGYFSIAIAMFLMAYGAMLAYLIIIGDTVALVFTVWSGQPMSHESRQITIFSVAVVAILPLALIKNMSKLANTSFMSLVAVGWIIFVVFGRSVTTVLDAKVPHAEEKTMHVVGANFFPAIGIMAFAFVCHHSSFIVFNSLSNNTAARWERVTRLSVGASLGACILLGTTGYLTFRELTKGNLLNNYALDDHVVNVTRLLFSLTMVLTYPMESFVARHTMHAVMFFGKGAMTEKRHYSLSLLLWASSVLIAMVVEDLGIVLELTGGVSATYIGFILPGALSLKLSKWRLVPWMNGADSRKAWGELWPAYGLLAFGLMAFVISTVQTFGNIASGEGSEGKAPEHPE